MFKIISLFLLLTVNSGIDKYPSVCNQNISNSSPCKIVNVMDKGDKIFFKIQKNGKTLNYQYIMLAVPDEEQDGVTIISIVKSLSKNKNKLMFEAKWFIDQEFLMDEKTTKMAKPNINSKEAAIKAMYDQLLKIECE